MREMCKFNFIEMNKNKNTSLEKLYTTNNKELIKRTIIELTHKQDYKTLTLCFV